MIKNIINKFNNYSFLLQPVKLAKSLGWVALAILALPTVIGSYLALKRAVAVWNKHETSDTQKTSKVAEKVLIKETAVDEDFDCIDQEPLSQSETHQLQIKDKKELYEAAISQFRSSNCLGSRSAEAYFDYLKSTGHGFYFNMDLLRPVAPAFDVFLTRIKEEMEQAKQENVSLIFVPFLLAGNMIREQHIVVAVINTAKQQIEYFDPKGNQLYSVFGSLWDRNLSQWNIPSQEFLKNLSAAIFPDKEKASVIRNLNGPQSPINRVDCGAHVLNFIQTRLHTDFIQSRHPNYFESSLSLNGTQLRNEMAATLEARLATIE